MRRIVTAAIIGLLSLTISIPPVAAAPTGSLPFYGNWEWTDWPVAAGQVQRTWMWGPQADSVALEEPYAESPGGMREVQYFDKSRMEITHPDGNQNSIWYVTNGLLAKELITGNLQLGDNTFRQYAPAQVNVAGDLTDPNGPTYASFNGLTSYAPIPNGWVITQTVNRAGQVGTDASTGSYNVTATDVGAPTHHNVASVFWAFMNSTGTVWNGYQDIDAPLFPNPFYATGYPLTEPYWTTVLVGGVSKQVLVQVFERRVLTYTPSNPAGWQVESGNVGLQYYQWRYQQLGLAQTPFAGPPPTVDMITSTMTNTVEVNDSTEHFTPGSSLTISDGQGGSLTAVIGTRFPTADAHGQLVFFWHNQDFLGWDTSTESLTIGGLTSPGPGVFAVLYVQYAPTDPLCCSSLPPVTVTYTWSGTSMQPNGTPPNLTNTRVQLIS